MPTMKEVTMRLGNLRLHAWGSFSNVYRGTLLSSDPEREVAIKKTWPDNRIRNFEMIFLTGIGRVSHKNIAQMMYAFTKQFGERVCESFVFEYFPDTLGSVIKRAVIDDVDVRLYTWQLFNGLRYLQSHYITHRDVKPTNILVDHEKGILQISDFGNAKIIDKGNPSACYQVTRFYRSPELLLGSTHYSWMIDVWSAGCCVGEMMQRRVVFPGRARKHQLKLIFQCLGVPTRDEMLNMKAEVRIDGKPEFKPVGLRGTIKDASKESVGFLSEILKYSPRERLHGPKLLRHPFFERIFQKGAMRSSGAAIKDIITPEDFATAMRDEHESGRQFVQMVRRGQFKFAWQNSDGKDSKDSKEIKDVKESKAVEGQVKEEKKEAVK